MTRAFHDSEKAKLLKKIEKGAKRRPYGFWKDRLQVLFEARDIMQAHGFETLPTPRKLTELGYSSFANAIGMYHGGFAEFRRLLGEQELRLRDGTWKDLEYCLGEARQLKERGGFERLPAYKKLVVLGCSSLATAIEKYHGGFHEFRELLGEGRMRGKANARKDLKFILEETRQVMEENGFETPPSSCWLRKNGYSGLSMAISKYHGGFPAFRQLLKERSKEKLDSVDALVQDLVGGVE